MSAPGYWRQQSQLHRLEGNSCTVCNAAFFPARPVCSACHATTLSPKRFRGKGQIVTYSVIRTSQRDSEGAQINRPARSPPYVIGIVKLDEGPQLTTEIIGCDPSTVTIGSRVRAVFRKLSEIGNQGVIHYGYKFELDE